MLLSLIVLRPNSTAYAEGDRIGSDGYGLITRQDVGLYEGVGLPARYTKLLGRLYTTAPVA